MKRFIALVSTFLLALVVTTGAQVRPPGRPIAATTARTAMHAADPAINAAFFDASVLHEIRLDINARDWQTLKENYQSNAYYPADFRWDAQVVRNVGIRSRGTASRSEVKPGLRVDFNRYAADQTLLGLTSFVLRNNTTDRTNMHERLSMLLFERLGVPAAAKETVGAS